MGQGYNLLCVLFIWCGTGIQIIFCLFHNAARCGYKLSFVFYNAMGRGYKSSLVTFIWCGTGTQIIVGSFYNAVRPEQKNIVCPFKMLWDRDTNYR